MPLRIVRLALAYYRKHQKKWDDGAVWWVGVRNGGVISKNVYQCVYMIRMEKEKKKRIPPPYDCQRAI